MVPPEQGSRASVTLRPAEPDDLLGMARVHVETWKVTYRGLVPDARLDQLTVDSDVAGGFGGWLRAPPPGVRQFVAVSVEEGVIGFAMGCPVRDPMPEYTGELGSIYVLPSHQGHGVGSLLVGEVVRHLLRTGHTSMVVWVLAQNPYRRFYERLGGVPYRTRTVQSRIAGIPLLEASYGWKDLDPLSRL